MDPRMNYFNNQYQLSQQVPVKLNYFQLYQKNSNFAAVKFIKEVTTKLEGEYYILLNNLCLIIFQFSQTIDLRDSSINFSSREQKYIKV